MSEDSAVARVEAFMNDWDATTTRIHRDAWVSAGVTGRGTESHPLLPSDLRELVAAARAWEAHTCGEAEIREKVAQEIEAYAAKLNGRAVDGLDSQIYGGLQSAILLAADVARGSAGGAS